MAHFLVLADGSTHNVAAFYPIWTSVNNHTRVVTVTYHGSCVINGKMIHATQYTSKRGFPYWREDKEVTSETKRLDASEKIARLQDEIEDLEASIEYNEVTDMVLAQKRLDTLKTRLNVLQ